MLEILIRKARPAEKWKITDQWFAWAKGEAAGCVRATETEAIAAVIRNHYAQRQSYSVEYVTGRAAERASWL